MKYSEISALVFFPQTVQKVTPFNCVGQPHIIKNCSEKSSSLADCALKIVRFYHESAILQAFFKKFDQIRAVFHACWPCKPDFTKARSVFFQQELAIMRHDPAEDCFAS
jgi:hypothetical protein